ncbi:MAG: ATPase, partial [Mesorhizobium sp.]
MNSVDDIDLIEETPAAAEAVEPASDDILNHAAAAAVEAADLPEDDEDE